MKPHTLTLLQRNILTAAVLNDGEADPEFIARVIYGNADHYGWEIERLRIHFELVNLCHHRLMYHEGGEGYFVLPKGENALDRWIAA